MREHQTRHEQEGRSRHAFRRRVAAAIPGLFVVGACVLIGVSALRDKKPATGSAANLTAHGVEVGQPSELRVGNALLRFPASVLPQPYSADEINKGKADKVTVLLDLKSWITPEPLANSEYFGLIRIGIEGNRTEIFENTRRALNGPWQSVIDHPETGLREYISADDRGGWGYRVYVPLDPMIRTPKGGALIYFCAGYPGRAPDRCRTQYQHLRGPYIEYYVGAPLLPNWKAVHTEVTRLVDGLIVSERAG